jgi:non-ribosomal peptide synthetase component F
MTLRQLCRQLRADAMLALEHVGLPFEVLLASREDRRDPGRSKQFQTMFSLQMADAPVTPRLGDARIEAVEYDATGARFDLSLDFRVGRAAARGRLEYNSDLFRADTAQWLADAYMRVLAQIVDCPEARLGALVLDDEATRGHALRLAAPSISADASGETLHGLFAAQAAARGEAIAVVCEGASLSYAELAARASRLARRLARLGVRAETPVGLCVERSLDLIVAMLAILEAGGAYVPLDPQLPQERLAYIAEDSGVALLVTTGALGERFAALPALPVLRLDALDLAQDELAQDEPEQDDEFDRRRASHPGRLAYVIYTSGSTGRPKGAQLSHRNAYSGIALADGHPNG